MKQIKLILYSEPIVLRILEIYLFENDSPEAIWGKELSERVAIYNYIQECLGCTTKIVGKALHTQGSEDITLKLEARSLAKKVKYKFPFIKIFYFEDVYVQKELRKGSQISFGGKHLVIHDMVLFSVVTVINTQGVTEFMDH